MAEKHLSDSVYDGSGQITSTGSADAYVIGIAQQLNGYYQGMPQIRFKANFTNSGAATANIVTQNAPAGLGAVTLKKAAGATDLAAGDIVSGGVYTLSHDGTNFQVLELNATIAAGSVGTTQLADDAVTNAKLADMVQQTIKARKTLSTGNPEDCTLSEVLDFIGSAAQGDILYRDASAWARLGAGTTGQFLQTQGAAANPAWAAAGGITAGTPQATTSGTAFDFGSLPAGIRRITVMFDEVSLSTGDSFLVQIGTSSGLETSGYESAGTLTGGGNSSGSSSAGFIVAATGTRTYSGHMTITRLSGNIWVSSYAMASVPSAAATVGGGRKTLSAELDRLRITRVAGNFDNGQVNILYE
jgi:hypothetical protein